MAAASAGLGHVTSQESPRVSSSSERKPKKACIRPGSCDRNRAFLDMVYAGQCYTIQRSNTSAIPHFVETRRLHVLATFIMQSSRLSKLVATSVFLFSLNNLRFLMNKSEAQVANWDINLKWHYHVWLTAQTRIRSKEQMQTLTDFYLTVPALKVEGAAFSHKRAGSQKGIPQRHRRILG